MKKQKTMTQTLIQNQLAEAHGQLAIAAKLAAESDNPFTFDDVERLKHLAEMVELALTDLCGVVKENSCI